MQTTITRNLLKYAAGRSIFCPLCQEVLDCKRTVILEAGSISKTLCASCWDTTLKPLIEAKGILAKCEVTDGRVWFKRRAAPATLPGEQA